MNIQIPENADYLAIAEEIIAFFKSLVEEVMKYLSYFEKEFNFEKEYPVAE